MTFYSIGDVAERCGINPVTLRAWQRRYGLLKPQRSEGGIDNLTKKISNGLRKLNDGLKAAFRSVKSKRFWKKKVDSHDGWESLQEEVMSVLRQVRPAKLRALIMSLGREHTADILIDHVFVPVRQRLSLDQSTARAMCSLLDGVLIDYAVLCLTRARKKMGKDALFISWGSDDRTRMWLEAWRLSQHDWNIDVLAEPLETVRPELFPGLHIFVWTGKALSRHQQEQFTHWREQGFAIALHGA
jgi:hypothetical protein